MALDNENISSAALLQQKGEEIDTALSSARFRPSETGIQVSRSESPGPVLCFGSGKECFLSVIKLIK